MTERYADPTACVDAILDRLGTDLTVGTPLGIGKPNHLLNELFERALENPDLELEIWTALSLSRPQAGSQLETRLLEPIADRLFGSYPPLTYDKRLQAEQLPPNVEVHQFYYQPGKHLDNPTAQQSYHSLNYTHALQALELAEPDLILQLVGTDESTDRSQLNLGPNTDITVDLIEMVRERSAPGSETMVVGQVNRNLPVMGGEAPISESAFDALLDDPAYDYTIVGPPSEPVELTEHAIGLRVSTLVPDGATLQIGIGSLSDAIGEALQLRHRRNGRYRDACDALGVHTDAGALVEDIGGLDRFAEGLYGATEMFVEAFLGLHEAGVLTREVYDDLGAQRLADAGHEDVTAATLDALLEEGVVPAVLSGSDVERLRRWGVFGADVGYEQAEGDESTVGTLVVGDERVPADLGRRRTRERLAADGLGEGLDGGRVLHGAFFIGSPSFYETLRSMDDRERDRFAMTSVQFTNDLYGEEELKRRHRRDARFVNTAMKATATGAVASDGLADGRVVSGVGGQFNFVNQAHELDGGRSILMLRATRESGGETESNVVWNYGHVTIPRHLRDIVVTEYGIADLRGKSDAEVIGELVQVADSRFQQELVERAKAAGKLPADWEIPPAYRDNYPRTLERHLGPFVEDGTLERFPYGTELTDIELTLARALREFQSTVEKREPRELLDRESLETAVRLPAAADPYLERLNLASPRGLRERILRRAVVLALARHGEL